jgi:hypothetical protein
MRDARIVMAMMSIKRRCTCTAPRNHLKASKQNDHSEFHWYSPRRWYDRTAVVVCVFVGKSAVWLVNVAIGGLQF